MKAIEKLRKIEEIVFEARAPYHFDANFHKPSHFPSSDNFWEKGKYWITMRWKGKAYGIKFENKGSIEEPSILAKIYGKEKLGNRELSEMVMEIRWRFNFDQSISKFIDRFERDGFLGGKIREWKGMKPIAANSLYETLMIYLVLQNATVRRSVRMLENLFERFGEKVRFDGKVLSVFWEPEKIAKSSEDELRKLKVGYRAKYFLRISKQFYNNEIEEKKIRKMKKTELEKTLLGIYGVGKATLEYLLFEDFYFLNELKTIPPWEQKILSKLIFDKDKVGEKKILRFFRKYSPYKKLAFHYVWEDLFWKRKHKHIEWLEKEIRL